MKILTHVLMFFNYLKLMNKKLNLTINFFDLTFYDVYVFIFDKNRLMFKVQWIKYEKTISFFCDI